MHITKRVVLDFLLMAAVLCGIGYFVHCQINTKLNAALEENVSRHIGTVSYSIEHTLNRTIAEMHMIAATIERGDMTIENLTNVAKAFNEKAYIIGILREDGSPIGWRNSTLTSKEFNDIKDVFSGEDVIAYFGEGGMIFAVPIEIDGETCAFYHQYDIEGVKDLLSVVSYDGLGRITLANLKGDWTEISDATINNKLFDEIYQTPGFLELYQKEVGNKVRQYGKAVHKIEYKGTVLMGFGAKIYNDKLMIFGCVTRDAVSGGIDFIHIGIISAFVALCMILITYMRSSIKAAENRELKAEKEIAWQASRTKSDFLSNMSHEIRTPINAVLGMNEMILRESHEEQILEYAENIRNAGNSLLGLVNDILDFSKIEAGKMEIIPVEYELSSLLNDLVNMIKPRAEKKNLKLIVNADKNLPTMLYGDEIRIKQVVTNILTNAVKYTEHGSVTLTVNFTKIGDNLIKIYFSVKDTGIGIKQEDIKKLYSAFERIEEKRNRTIEGTGLGMNITKKLLNMMGTNLQVESIYGEGSNFWFEIDQKVINAAPIGDFEEAFRNSLKQHKAYHEKFTAPDAHILVVDDTAMNLTVVKGLLKQTKIKIDTADSGFECLKLVKQNKYDIIFLDHRMPEMDGIETLRKMQNMKDNLNETTPVISLTANAISGAREEYIRAGFRDYLTKPIDSAKLEELIMQYLPAEKIKAASENTIEPTEELHLPDWLIEAECLNLREGVEHCGDVDSYMEALKVFANSIESGAAEIENYFKNADWKLYTTKVHALKSSARVIGANELSEKARRLEDAGNSGYINEIQQDTEPLLKLYRSYIEKLSPLIENKSEEDNSDKPLIDEDSLAEAFEAMKEAAATFDYDSIEFVLQSLEDYSFPQNETEKIKQIKSAAEKLDWEKIAQLLK